MPGSSLFLAQAPFAIFTIALATSIVGLIGWLRAYLTGDWTGVEAFFRYPNAFFTLLFAGAGTGFSFYARSQFAERNTLRSAWTILSFAAVAHFAARLLQTVSLGALSAGPTLHEAGEVIGGPVQFALLLVGLVRVAGSLRQLGVHRRLTRTDYLLFALVGALTMRTLFGVYQFVDAGKMITWAQAILWTTDPLLLMLLIVTVFIRRSVLNLGHGMIANCWRSYVAAVVLTSFADASLWCSSCSSIAVWNSLGWYVWLIADAAFALGPAYQVAAIERVRAGSRILKAIAVA